MILNGGLFHSSHGDFARPRQVTDAKVLHQFQELVDLAFVSSDFDSQTFRLNIHDLCPKNVAYLHYFRPICRIGIHTKHYQLTIDIVSIPKILNLNHVHELVQLFRHLLQNRVISAYHDRHSGCRGIIRRCNIQTIDVESASTEHASNPSKNAKLVFNQNRYRVTHNEG